jgi:hypothetical protein
MVTNGYSRLQRLWRRRRLYVGRSWRSEERLSVAVDGLSDVEDPFAGYWTVGGGHADDVLRLLHGDPSGQGSGTADRLGPVDGQSVGPRPITGTVAGDSDTTIWSEDYDWGRLTVSVARYSDCE